MKFLLSLFFIAFSTLGFSQGFRGDGLLNVLGQQRDSSESYAIFAREWGLGRKTSLPEKGFKISRNYETQRVTALFFAGKGFESGTTKFNKFEGQMPFGLSMDDGFEPLLQKLGAPNKSGDDYAKFSKNGLNIIAKFKNKSRTKLEYIKIALGFGQLTYNPDYKEPVEDEEADEQPSEGIVDAKPVNENVSNRTKVIVDETTPADFSGVSNRMNTSSIGVQKSPFYRAIMKAMQAGSESYFETVKRGDLATISNFWNYKYTYSTSLRIPGEKYNFIYSFPFSTSQKDFVSVIKEGVYDSSFKTAYDNLLVIIKDEFPYSEGWKYTYPKDEDPNFPLKDVEIQNERYGSVVLDFHKRPTGESVLYIRFILYYD